MLTSAQFNSISLQLKNYFSFQSSFIDSWKTEISKLGCFGCSICCLG